MDYAVPATVANMRLYKDVPGMVMYSHWTQEEYSAHYGDYWDRNAGEVFTDSDDFPMWLVYKETAIRDVGGY
tara:strand:+ start:309 stop:524 length:216 start_codon:yes stop_codon:yes gene_type:complete